MTEMTKAQRDRQNAEDIARAGVSATYVGRRSLASRDRMYQVPTEFGNYLITRDNGTWAPMNPQGEWMPVVRETRTVALAQVARDVLARRATTPTAPAGADTGAHATGA